MVLGFTLAVIIGVGGAADGAEPPSIPDSPADALSLEQVEPNEPVIDPWQQPLAGVDAPKGGRVLGTDSSPEQILATLTFLLVLAATLAPRRGRVESAIASVRSGLSDNLFSDVTHGDLASIEETLIGLSPWEREITLNALSDREVSVWMRELDGFNGSFSEAEETRLFAGLVPGISGASLVRLVEGGKGKEVVAALSSHGTSSQRVKLAGELASGLEGKSKLRRLIPQLVDSTSADTMETEVSGWIERGELGPRLDELFAVGVDESSDAEAGYRLDGAASLARSGSGFSESAVKAALFVELVERLTALKGHRWKGSVGEVLAGTTQMLRSDVSGIFGQLNHRLDPHGNTTSQWVEEMIDEDRIDELDVLLADLLGGTDRLAHFSNPGTKIGDPYPNASNLGYFVGSYQLAIEQMAEDAEGKIELVGILFAIVTGVIPGPRGGRLDLPAGPLVDLHARNLIDGFQGKATEVKQTLWGLAKPRTDDGLLWNGPGTTQFQDAWEEVVEVR